MARVNIELKTRSDVSGLRELRAEAKRADEDLRRLATGTSDVLRTVGAVAGVTAGVESLRAFTNAGFDMNRMLQSTRLGLAAVFQNFRTNDVQNFAEALDLASEAQKRLREESQKTGGFRELLESFQSITGELSKAGVSLNNQIHLALLLKTATTSLGLTGPQVTQEARALVTGNIGPDAQVARQLGITGPMVKQARDQGQLFQFLTDKLKTFENATVAASDTFEVRLNNLTQSYEFFAAAVTKPAFDELAKGFGELKESLDEQGPQTIHSLGEELRQLVSILNEVAKFLVQHAALIKDIAVAYGTWKLAATGVSALSSLQKFSGNLAAQARAQVAAQPQAVPASPVKSIAELSYRTQVGKEIKKVTVADALDTMRDIRTQRDKLISDMAATTGEIEAVRRVRGNGNPDLPFNARSRNLPSELRSREGQVESAQRMRGVLDGLNRKETELVETRRKQFDALRALEEKERSSGAPRVLEIHRAVQNAEGLSGGGFSGAGYSFEGGRLTRPTRVLANFENAYKSATSAFAGAMGKIASVAAVAGAWALAVLAVYEVGKVAADAIVRKIEDDNAAQLRRAEEREKDMDDLRKQIASALPGERDALREQLRERAADAEKAAAGLSNESDRQRLLTDARAARRFADISDDRLDEMARKEIDRQAERLGRSARERSVETAKVFMTDLYSSFAKSAQDEAAKALASINLALAQADLPAGGLEGAHTFIGTQAGNVLQFEELRRRIAEAIREGRGDDLATLKLEAEAERLGKAVHANADTAERLGAAVRDYNAAMDALSVKQADAIDRARNFSAQLRSLAVKVNGGNGDLALASYAVQRAREGLDAPDNDRVVSARQALERRKSMPDTDEVRDYRALAERAPGNVEISRNAANVSRSDFAKIQQDALFAQSRYEAALAKQNEDRGIPQLENVLKAEQAAQSAERQSAFLSASSELRRQTLENFGRRRFAFDEMGDDQSRIGFFNATLTRLLPEYGAGVGAGGGANVTDEQLRNQANQAVINSDKTLSELLSVTKLNAGAGATFR